MNYELVCIITPKILEGEVEKESQKIEKILNSNEAEKINITNY